MGNWWSKPEQDGPVLPAWLSQSRGSPDNPRKSAVRSSSFNLRGRSNSPMFESPVLDTDPTRLTEFGFRKKAQAL